MKHSITHIWHFYLEGFQSMTWGRALWFLILVKLFILFFILRLFFFPDYLRTVAADEEKDEYVSRELIIRIHE